MNSGKCPEEKDRKVTLSILKVLLMKIPVLVVSGTSDFVEKFFKILVFLKKLDSRNETGVPRNAANARERARMRVLSSAFSKLKTKLPNIPADTKLSKLDTLRLATIYIKQLKGLVEGDESSNEEAPVKFNHSQNSLVSFSRTFYLLKFSPI